MIENLLLVYVVSAVLYFCWNVWRAHVGDMNTIDILSNRVKHYENRIMELQIEQSNFKSVNNELFKTKDKQILEWIQKTNALDKKFFETEKERVRLRDQNAALNHTISVLENQIKKRKVTK